MLTLAHSETFAPLQDFLPSAEERLLVMNRNTEQFLATLGHEMRNPLSALSYALDFWPIALKDPVEMEELRQLMLRQVRQLMHLSENLLDGARIAQGKMKLHRQQVAIGQLVQEACEQVQPFVRECGHKLVVQVAAEPLIVNCDAARLIQVFANLIQNAAKFTTRNGTLQVAVEESEGMAVVTVRDNGRGLEPHVLESIFEAFGQIVEIIAPTNDGLGLGLPLAKTIVGLHGGDISAHSDGLGCGSEFRVRLPIA